MKLINPLKAAKDMFNEFRNQILKKFDRKQQVISSRITEEIADILRETETFQSLKSGTLKGHFGLTDHIDLDRIVDEIAKDIRIYRRGKNVTVDIVQDSFRAALDLEDATQITEKGEELPWLHWLLFEGNRIIISDHRFKPIVGAGRSNLGIMVQKGFWRVPSQYSGTHQSNWITRALEEDMSRVGDRINKILEQELLR